MSSQFVHLHNHTDSSALDGTAKPTPLAEKAAQLGMPAVAITDHGTLSGLYDFYQACTKNGVKPILGLESYFMPIDYSRTHAEPIRIANGGDDDISGRGSYTHVTIWAENNTGLRNLYAMSTGSYESGLYVKPRIDIDLLSRHAEGIIATTGCPSGEIQTLLRLGRYDEARRVAGTFQDILGKDNYFLELMDHGLAVETRAREGLIRLSKDLNIPLLATNDLHYVNPEDAPMHEAFLCVQSGSNMQDPNRFKFDANTFYLRPANEMRELFRDLPEACDNTLLIAERCNATIEPRDGLMPVYPTGNGHNSIQAFSLAIREGLAKRLGVPADEVPKEYRDRAVYEFGVIKDMGFADYFLITADFVNWAKENGILVGAGRGSAGGSLAAWATGITNIDPIRHGLLFERFLNPERISMPDIDIDFDDRRRGEVIEYVRRKYGQDRVVQIGTYSVIKAKSAIKDAARALGVEFHIAEAMTKTYPPDIMGASMALAGVEDENHPRHKEASKFRDLVGSNPEARKVFDLALKFEGMRRGMGMHAAGIIMSAEPIENTVPLMRSKKDGPLMTAFDYPTCEALGLLKMDFLGLSNLGTIDEALRSIGANGGDVDLDHLIDTLDDKSTYELLASGDTLGVFQLDSAPMRALLRKMQPDKFADISAVLALYRPGPMAANAHNDYADYKNNRKPIRPIHPELKEPLAEVLDETYSLIVYQEQIQRVAQIVAGYSLGQADLLRRAMGKKKKEILDKEYVPFREGMKKNGYSDEAIKKLWDVLVPFAQYAFNKSHSAGYGLISYITAYLKTHYPVEYMAALLTTNETDKDKVAVYLGETRRLGIEIAPPDVNKSNLHYTPVAGEIRIGLSSIRNIGVDKGREIIAERERGGDFVSFADFLARMNGSKALNSRAIDSLIRAGAFDGFGHARAALASSLVANKPYADGLRWWSTRVVKVAEREAAGKKPTPARIPELDAGREFVSVTAAMTVHSVGLGEILSSVEVLVPVMPEWPASHIAQVEKEMLGRFVTVHPLDGKDAALAAAAKQSITEVKADEELEDDSRVTIAGLVVSVSEKTTKRGDRMGVFVVADRDNEIECVAFPRVWAKVSSACSADGVVRVVGRAQFRDAGMNVLVDQVSFVQ